MKFLIILPCEHELIFSATKEQENMLSYLTLKLQIYMYIYIKIDDVSKDSYIISWISSSAF